jgi:putative radical SAM enzyme (TIGR03279 family)
VGTCAPKELDSGKKMAAGKKKQLHTIAKVLPGSIAEEMGLEPGDSILSINGTEMEDIFDYQYLVQDSYIEVMVLTKDGEECKLEIDKEEDEDLGVEFEQGLMDDYRRCSNNCIFCFIDQNPPGMRETLYFKDDDTRLSFLQGNYVTLTNLSDRDIERMIKYRMEPINISFQTTNPELRCKMLNNRFAGEALKKVQRLYEGGIHMNGQIVLCKGINDGEELRRSISDLSKMIPILESVSVVPVGLTKYREGLFPLEPFDAKDSAEVIDFIEGFQRDIYEKHGIHFVHASDEWYIVAGRDIPSAEAYDGYGQIENGVGKVRLLMDEFREELEILKEKRSGLKIRPHKMTIVTGMLVYPIIRDLMQELQENFPEVEPQVIPVINHFFGEGITVTGLLTAGDIIDQLKDKDLGDYLLLSQNVLRSGEDIFLDDLHVPDVENALNIKIRVTDASGADVIRQVLDL